MDARTQQTLYRDERLLNIVAQNEKLLGNCRVASSIAAGATAGVLGLSGVGGFVFFVVASLLVTVAVYARLRSSASVPYASLDRGVLSFFSSHTTLFTSAGGGLTTYIVFWTLFYNLAHVYY